MIENKEDTYPLYLQLSLVLFPNVTLQAHCEFHGADLEEVLAF